MEAKVLKANPYTNVTTESVAEYEFKEIKRIMDKFEVSEEIATHIYHWYNHYNREIDGIHEFANYNDAYISWLDSCGDCEICAK